MELACFSRARLHVGEAALRAAGPQRPEGGGQPVLRGSLPWWFSNMCPFPLTLSLKKLLGSTEDSLKNTLWVQTFRSTDGYLREGRLAPGLRATGVM